VEVIESKTTPTLTSRPTTLIQPQSKQPLSLDDEDNSDSDVNTFECDHCWFTTRDREDMINHLVQKHGFGQTAAKVTIVISNINFNIILLKTIDCELGEVVVSKFGSHSKGRGFKS
jgi:hypothetical protein